jgi:hypothetical protein
LAFSFERYERGKDTVISFMRCCYSTCSAKYSIDKVSRFLSVEKRKNRMYSDNLHALDELEHNTCETITSVKVINSKIVSHNIFRSLEVKERIEDILRVYCDNKIF